VVGWSHFQFNQTETTASLNVRKTFYVINLDARRLYSAPVDRSTGLICDQTIALNGKLSSRYYPGYLRRIRYRDPETGQGLVFLTNHTLSPAMTICLLYKSRWQVELFFKWIKQHLRIKRFYGTSENAVKTQIWIAVSVYVLIAIIRKELNLTTSMHTLLQILSVTLFEKMPLQQALDENAIADLDPELLNQLKLFDS
jgi:transposase